MKIAELFVALGVKGDGQAQKALNGVKGTLGAISTEGLAAKAAILGVVYGLERLSSNSAKTGADLASFSAATGLSIDNLQRWQYAAKLANVGADEMKSSFIGLQSSMLKMAQGGGAPSGFNVIANAVNVDMKKIRDTQYMMEKLRDYAKTEKNIDFANDKLQSMGLSLEWIAAARRGKLDAGVLKSAPVYSNGQVNALDNVNAGWAKLNNQWEMGIGGLTAQFGPSMLKDMSLISKEVLKMIGAFAQLAKQTDLLKGLSLIFEGWGNIFGLITLGAEKLAELAGANKDKTTSAGLMEGWSSLMGGGFKASKGAGVKSVFGEYAAYLAGHGNGAPDIAPKVRPGASAGNSSTTNVNQTNYIHAQDGKEVVSELTKAQKRATNKAGQKSQAKVRAN